MINPQEMQAELEKQKIFNSEQERILHNMEILSKMEPETASEKLLKIAQENRLYLPDNFGEMYQSERRFLPQLKAKFSDNSPLMQKQASLAVYAYQQNDEKISSFSVFIEDKLSEGNLEKLSQEMLQKKSRLDLMRVGLLAALAAASRQKAPQQVVVHEDAAPQKAEVALPQDRSLQTKNQSADENIDHFETSTEAQEQINKDMHQFQEAQVQAQQAQENQAQKTSYFGRGKKKKPLAQKVMAGALAGLLTGGTIVGVGVALEEDTSVPTNNFNVSGVV